jgi:ribosomal protein S12 methylthiotransferase accessory factor
VTLAATYLNERLELLDGVYDEARQAELDALLRPYNRLLGPVTGVTVYPPELGDLSMYSGMARHARLRGLTPNVAVRPHRGSDGPVPGGGKGGSVQRAFLGALGELAERLLTVLHYEAVQDELVHETYEQLAREGRRALGPDELPLFAAEQYAQPGFAYSRFRTDMRINWIEGRDLVSGETVLVPAQLVLFNYRLRQDEARIGYATTGGLGCHPDRRRAILHGLCEVIERDAVNLRWYCRLPPPRVEVDLAAVLADEGDMPHARMSTPYIDRVTVYLNTVDVPIPVLTATAFDRSRREGAFVSGGGAWSGRGRALTQALFELGQSRNFFRQYDPLRMKHIRADSSVSEMTDFFHAAVYYGYPENVERLSWYLAGEAVTRWDAVPDVSADAVSALVEDAVIIDFGRFGWPDISVMKVFVPGLTQASVPSHPYLGHRRYYDMPMRLGASDRRLRFDELTRDPLPLP